jgi:hypothetical protein
MKYENPTPELIYSRFVDFRTRIRIILKDKTEVNGIIQSFSPGTTRIGDIKTWHFLESDKRDDYEKTKSKDLVRDIQHSEIKSIESLEP